MAQASDFKQENLLPFKEGWSPIKGGSLYYKMFGTGSPIVLLHGGPGLNHNHFLPQMLELAK